MNLAKPERIAIARLSGIAMRHAGGRGRGDPIAELHDVSDDPRLLALAAAGYAARADDPSDPRPQAALDMLRQAGADEAVIAAEAPKVAARLDRLGRWRGV